MSSFQGLLSVKMWHSGQITVLFIEVSLFQELSRQMWYSGQMKVSCLRCPDREVSLSLCPLSLPAMDT